MPEASPSVSQTLAGLAADTSWDMLPEAVRHEAKRALLNVLGCALGVARSPAVDQIIAVHRQFAGPPQATVVGRPERLDMLGASFVNAMAGNFLDFDDTHLNTVIHPSAPVASPALALGEVREALRGGHSQRLRARGRNRLPHRQWRVARPLRPGLAHHLHLRCLRRPPRRARSCSACRPNGSLMRSGSPRARRRGSVENLPTAAKNVSVGSAARNGLFAALMAQAGWQAAPRAIEGRLGWARASGDEPDIAVMLAGLGQEWEFLNNTYKPYPSGIVFHAVTDACLELRRDHASRSRRDPVGDGRGRCAAARTRRPRRSATSGTPASRSTTAPPSRSVRDGRGRRLRARSRGRCRASLAFRAKVECRAALRRCRAVRPASRSRWSTAAS